MADLLCGDFKQFQYGRVILPFTLLRRLECVLTETKDAAVAKYNELKASPLPEDAEEKFLLRESALFFFNALRMDLGKMGQNDIKANLESYVQASSPGAREIFEHFKSSKFVGLLEDANLLLKVVKKFTTTDLSPKVISDYETDLVFEEFVRCFTGSSNEIVGEHFTPRDIVRLTISLVFMKGDKALTRPNITRTIYDPTTGTGDFPSSDVEYVHELNPNAVMQAFGRELNPESYTTCKVDMLVRGQDVSRIELGNTLSSNQLPLNQFDYILSNPPLGAGWKEIEGEINDEHTQEGLNGHFGPGLPRVSDGLLLLLTYLISKMCNNRNVGGTVSSGGHIGIILNGSPLFTGGMSSGKSEIRHYILEADLLEGIIALPTDTFYNTGIATYVRILSNKRAPGHRDKMQLIDDASLCGKTRKSPGSKRNLIDNDDIELITKTFGDLEVVDVTTLEKLGLERTAEQKSNRGRQPTTAKTEAPKTFASRISDGTDFGYRCLTIERPLRLSAQVIDEAVTTLRLAPKSLNVSMKRLYDGFTSQWHEESYGDFSELRAEVRAIIKAEFAGLEKKQIKDLLNSKLWLSQRGLVEKAQQIQTALSTRAGGKTLVSNGFSQLQLSLKRAIKAAGVKLDAKENKQSIDAITTKNPNAELVVKKVLREAAQPLYGASRYRGKAVESRQDGELRNNESVPLSPIVSTSDLIENYFKAEVPPHMSDVWINTDKRDVKDGEAGTVGYEIPFSYHFYVYQSLCPLSEVGADPDAVNAEIMKPLQKVHSR